MKLTNTLIGEVYLGFSHIGANNATVVNDIVEVIHSGGGQDVLPGGSRATTSTARGS